MNKERDQTGIEHSEPVKGAQPGRGGHRLLYLPGLDGLRALAVIAVLLYHAELPWIAGGFLGVEIFFVLSGYLITSLLLSEWRQEGRIDLRAFWFRRARRLLPALFLLLVVTLTYAALFLPGEVTRLRVDALAAAGYVTNWYLIFSQQSYFEAMSRPSLLQHLWSLAVEEQFYLLWPLLIVLGLRILRTRLRMLMVVVLGAAASAGLMALLYQPDADVSRIYYGTDTRAAGLLIGSALAFVRLRPKRSPLQARRWVAGRMGSLLPVLPDMAGFLALAGLAAAVLFLSETQSFLYQGGLALVALLTAVVIAVISHPTSRLLPGLLAQPVLRWVGQRSYGIYLWHWPVYSVTRPQLDLPLDGAPLFLLRLTFTFLLAEVSYRWVETPIRSGSLGRSWQALRAGRGTRGWLGARWAGAALSGTLLALLLGMALVNARPPEIPDYLAAPDINTSASLPANSAANGGTILPVAEPTQVVAKIPQESPVTTPSQVDESGVVGPTVLDTPVAAQPRVQPPMLPTTAAISNNPVSPATEQVSPTGTAPLVDAQIPPTSAAGTGKQGSMLAAVQAVTALPTQPPVAQPSPQPSPRPLTYVSGGVVPSKVYRITAIGDSVMIGAAPELTRVLGNIDIDAAKSRAVSVGIDLLRARSAAGLLGDVVIIHLGNNSYFSAREFDEMMAAAGSGRTVIFMNLKVPRRWEAPDNAVIAAGVKRYPNAVLIDWRSAIMRQPALLAKDGIHIGPGGARVYAQLVAAALGR
ncbi:MAG: acyltransferase family protein [Chloroflexota bacterium]|nr:acyltransferase family protein [Chloroflexota bacterium]